MTKRVRVVCCVRRLSIFFFEDIIVVDVVVWFVIDAVKDVYERPRQRVHNERVIDV